MKPSSKVAASADSQELEPSASGNSVNGGQDGPVSTSSGSAESQDVDAAPVTALREVLMTAWGGILGVEKIGIHDDFFELGVDSVLGIQLISQLNRMFRMDLPVVCLFEAPTVEQLAQYMIAHEARPGLTERTATFLKEIENMSEGEVSRRLRSKDESESSAHD